MSTMGGDELLIRAALKDELTGPLEGIRDELRKTARETKNAGTQANFGARGFDKMAAGAGRFVKAGVGMAAKAAAAGVAALTVAVVAGSAKVLQLASDAGEAASAFNTVFKGVSGNVAGYLDRMNKRFGIATIELHKAATTFGVFGKAAGVSRKELGGFTKDLVGAGMDLASFYNEDPTEVFTALRSGLAGEAEPLRRFGIFLSDAAMKAEAATMGLTGELTESQKVMVRQQLIMKSLGDAQGDMVRTQDSLANKSKALKGRFQDLATEVGNRLVPYAEKAANVLDRKLGRLMDRLPGILNRVELAAVGLWEAFQQGGPDAVVAKVDIITDSGGKLIDLWNEAKSIGEDLATVVTGVLVPAFGDAAGATGGLSSPLGILRDVLGWAADHTDLLRAALTAYIVVATAGKLIQLGLAAATKAKAVADTIALINLKAHTVGTKTHLVVSKAARVATLAWAGAQKVLNLAMKMNPIGLVITALTLLVGGLVLAYKKSETFRKIVDAAFEAVADAGRWLWNEVLQPVFKFLVEGFATVLEFYGKMLHGLAKVPGFGWAEKAADGMDAAAGKARDLAGAIKDIPDKDVKVNIVPPSAAQVSKVNRMLGPGAIGDTATSKAHGGHIANTFAAHASVAAATGTRPTITNVLTGGGGKGRGSGDHQAGRALDLVGKGLNKYGAHMRAIGGYAAFHGSGPTRHLHAVPPVMGDTRTSVASRVRARVPAGGGGGITIAEGAIRVEVTNPGTNVDVKVAVREALEEYLRDEEERA